MKYKLFDRMIGKTETIGKAEALRIIANYYDNPEEILDENPEVRTAFFIIQHA